MAAKKRAKKSKRSAKRSKSKGGKLTLPAIAKRVDKLETLAKKSGMSNYYGEE